MVPGKSSPVEEQQAVTEPWPLGPSHQGSSSSDLHGGT